MYFVSEENPIKNKMPKIKLNPPKTIIISRLNPQNTIEKIIAKTIKTTEIKKEF